VKEMSAVNQPSRQETIEYLAGQLDGPILLEDFVQRVLSMWHSNAKNPEAGVRQAVRDDYLGNTFLFLDEKTIVPPRIALKGVRLRVPLTQAEHEAGYVRFTPAFTHIVKMDPYEGHPENLPLTFVTGNGRSQPMKFVTTERISETPFGPQMIKILAVDLSGWEPFHEAQIGDSLIITILDWENGRYQFDLESAGGWLSQAQAIAKRNQMLADMLYQDLEQSRYEEVWSQKAVLTTLIRLPRDEVIPDHWLWVIKDDGRMDWTGNQIRYQSDFNYLSIFFDDVASFPEEAEHEVPLTAVEEKQVYRFKAYLKYHKELWRRIEIQGVQTLADLDTMLHSAFNHDWDHLSGFWHLIPRGKGRRPRQIELATIYPFGDDGFGDDTQIAALKLEPGAQLKYVYDFGDWIEHRLELETIEAPQSGVEYPRQIAQNKPRYRYCPVCKEKGKKEIATWICIDCSNKEGKNVLICEDCLDKLHQDHYTDELLY
jgi:hypothetical protein